MADRQKASIYMRFIKLDVVIPDEHAWDFMKEFGEVFSAEGPGGSRQIRAVDGYYDHPNGMHVVLSFSQHEESKFNNWYDLYCKDRGIEVREGDEDSGGS